MTQQVKISALPAITELTDSDILVVVDQETSTTRRITAAEAGNYFGSEGGSGGSFVAATASEVSVGTKNTRGMSPLNMKYWPGREKLADRTLSGITFTTAANISANQIKRADDTWTVGLSSVNGFIRGSRVRVALDTSNYIEFVVKSISEAIVVNSVTTYEITAESNTTYQKGAVSDNDSVSVTIIDPIQVKEDIEIGESNETGFTYLQGLDTGATGARKQVVYRSDSEYTIVVPMNAVDSYLRLYRKDLYLAFKTSAGTRRGRISGVTVNTRTVNNQINQEFTISLADATGSLGSYNQSISVEVEGFIRKAIREHVENSGGSGLGGLTVASPLTITTTSNDGREIGIDQSQLGTNFDADNVLADTTTAITRTVESNGSVKFGENLTAGLGIDRSGNEFSAEAEKLTHDLENASNDGNAAIPAWSLVMEADDFIYKPTGSDVEYIPVRHQVPSNQNLGFPIGVNKIAIPASSGGNSGIAESAIITRGWFDLHTTDFTHNTLTVGSDIFIREVTNSGQKSYMFVNAADKQSGDKRIGVFKNFTGQTGVYTVYIDFESASNYIESTDDLPEGTKKYYSDSQVDTFLGSNVKAGEFATWKQDTDGKYEIDANASALLGGSEFKDNVDTFLGANVTSGDFATWALNSDGKYELNANALAILAAPTLGPAANTILDHATLVYDSTNRQIEVSSANVVSRAQVYARFKAISGNMFIYDDTNHIATANTSAFVTNAAVYTAVSNVFIGNGVQIHSNGYIEISRTEAAGIGYDSFPSKEGVALTQSDVILMGDASASSVGRITLGKLNDNIDPTPSREIGFPGYRTEVTSSPTTINKGEIVLPATIPDSNTTDMYVYIRPLDDDSEAIKAVLKAGFLLQVYDTSSPARNWRWVVTSPSYTQSGDALRVSTRKPFYDNAGATFGDGVSVVFYSDSRSVSFDNIQNNHAAEGDGRFDIPSMFAMRDHVQYEINNNWNSNTYHVFEQIHDRLENNTSNTNMVTSNLESYAATTNTTIGSVNTAIGSVNTAIGSVNTAIGSVNTAISSVNTAIDSVNNNIDVVSSNVGLATDRANSYLEAKNWLAAGPNVYFTINDTDSTLTVDTIAGTSGSGERAYYYANSNTTSVAISSDGQTIYSDIIEITPFSSDSKFGIDYFSRLHLIRASQGDMNVDPYGSIEAKIGNGNWTTIIDYGDLSAGSRDLTPPFLLESRQVESPIGMVSNVYSPNTTSNVSFRAKVRYGSFPSQHSITVNKQDLNVIQLTGKQGGIQESRDVRISRYEGGRNSSPVILANTSITPSSTSSNIAIEVGMLQLGLLGTQEVVRKIGSGGTWSSIDSNVYADSEHIFIYDKTQVLDQPNTTEEVFYGIRLGGLTHTEATFIKVTEYPLNRATIKRGISSNSVNVLSKEGDQLVIDSVGNYNSNSAATVKVQTKANTDTDWTDLESYSIAASLSRKENRTIIVPDEIFTSTGGNNDYRITGLDNVVFDVISIRGAAETLEQLGERVDTLSTTVDAIDPDASSTYESAPSLTPDRTADGILYVDNSAGKVYDMPLREFDTISTPVQLKQETLTGYTYKNTVPGNGLADGEVHVTVLNSQDAIYLNPNDVDQTTLEEVFTQDYKVRIQESASIFIEGVATGTATGPSNTLIIYMKVLKKAGTFTNDGSITLITEGKHPDRSEVDYDLVTPNNANLSSSNAITNFVHLETDTANVYTTMKGIIKSDANTSVSYYDNNNVIAIDSVGGGGSGVTFTEVADFTANSHTIRVDRESNSKMTFHVIDGRIGREHFASDAFSTDLENREGNASNAAVTAQGLNNRITLVNRRHTFTGYTRTTGQTLGVGEYRIDTSPSQLVVRPKTDDRSTMTLVSLLGQQASIENADRSSIFSALITTDATVSENLVTIPINSTYVDDLNRSGLTSNTTIYIEGTGRHNNREDIYTFAPSDSGGGANVSFASNTQIRRANTNVDAVSAEKLKFGLDVRNTLFSNTSMTRNTSGPNQTGEFSLNETTDLFGVNIISAERAKYYESIAVGKRVRLSKGDNYYEGTIEDNDVIDDSSDSLYLEDISKSSTTPSGSGITLEIYDPKLKEVVDNFKTPDTGSVPLTALATIPAGQLKGLSAAGNSGIGTRLGTVSDTVWNTISATNSQLMPVPHPNSSTTPAGTGEISFTPKSAKSSFLCLIQIGFGWLEGNAGPKVHFVLARKIGNGSWTVVNKQFNVLNGTYGSVDFNVTPIAVDAPNTTQEVTYRWMIVRGNTNRVYPISQNAAMIEVTNL